MWGIMITVFLALYGLMIFYIGRRGFTILCKSTSRINKIIYLVFFILLALLFPASEVFQNSLPGTAGLWLAILGGYSMVAVSYMFLLLLIIDLFRMIDKRIIGFVPKVIREHKGTPIVLSALVVATVITALLYGGWNAQNPVVKEYSLTVDKKAGSLKGLKIAMVSDIHYGAIINAERLNSMVRIVNDLQSDIIVLAGDITEGAPRQEEAKKLADKLGEMKAKYGKFAVPGNHDRGLYNDDTELSRYFKEAGVNVLTDKYLKVQDSFYVIGRNDLGYRGESREELRLLMNGVDTSMPLILLDHQPFNLTDAEKNGVDLQLSGHTHVGQIFPINLITGQVYELDWGLLHKDKYNLIVSSGYGTWGPPLRLGSNSEVVSITVKFSN